LINDFQAINEVHGSRGGPNASLENGKVFLAKAFSHITPVIISYDKRLRNGDITRFSQLSPSTPLGVGGDDFLVVPKKVYYEFFLFKIQGPRSKYSSSRDPFSVDV